MKRKPSQKVEIIWIDAASDRSGWMESSDAAAVKPYLVSTLGHLLRKDKEYVVLAQNSRVDEDHVSCLMEIPTKNVKSIKRVR